MKQAAESTSRYHSRVSFHLVCNGMASAAWLWSLSQSRLYHVCDTSKHTESERTVHLAPKSAILGQPCFVGKFSIELDLLCVYFERWSLTRWLHSIPGLGLFVFWCWMQLNNSNWNLKIPFNLNTKKRLGLQALTTCWSLHRSISQDDEQVVCDRTWKIKRHLLQLRVQIDKEYLRTPKALIKYLVVDRLRWDWISSSFKVLIKSNIAKQRMSHSK